jgi:glycogen synthase
MKEIYSKSKIFIHLSDHEGFGLPPLEAMGSGCVPLCRHSGGVIAYMSHFEAHGLLLQKTQSVDDIVYSFNSLLNDVENLKLLSKKATEVFTIGLKREKFKIFINKVNSQIYGDLGG